MSIFQQLDSQLDELLAGWSVYSSLLLIVLSLYFIYPVISHVDPEIHPFLLERQSAGTRVRQPGETAIYRALETPHGYPLKSGLGIRDPGQPKWTVGRDGDLRDVWRRACLGKPAANDETQKEVGLLKTISGNEEVLESTFDELSKELNAIGKYLKSRECKRVAIYLSNSTELLVALMAGSFYDFTPILIPPEQPLEVLAMILRDSWADAFIAGAGSVPLNNLSKKYSELNQVIWVAPRSSRHMDWNEVPEGEGGKAEISTWHDIVEEEGSFASSELPSIEAGSSAPNVFLVSTSATDHPSHRITKFTQKNLVSAISAQLTALPHAHRLSPSDTFLPLSTLTSSYPLILTLSALYSNATIALTSVTGPTAPLPSTISPTILLLDPSTLYAHESRLAAQHSSFFARQLHNRRLASLARGIMPNVLPKSDVRLIYTWNAGNAQALNNYRAYTGTRIINAFTRDEVAGAVAQTNPLDYRPLAHFGPPLPCLELWLEEVEGCDVGGEEPVGELVVKGPAVRVSAEEGAPAEVGTARGGKGKMVMKITGGGTLARGGGSDDVSREGAGISEGVRDALRSPVAG